MRSYGMGVTTLEEVFLRVSQSALQQEDGEGLLRMCACLLCLRGWVGEVVGEAGNECACMHACMGGFYI